MSFYNKFFAKKPIDRDTFLGSWGDKKDAVLYGAWKTYIYQLGLEQEIECLNQQVNIDVDYGLAALEMWLG